MAVEIVNIKKKSTREKVSYATSWATTFFLLCLFVFRGNGFFKDTAPIKYILGYNENSKAHLGFYFFLLLLSIVTSLFMTIEF